MSRIMKIIMITMITAMIVIAGVLISMLVGNTKWESFDKNDLYKGFFDNPIVEMELQKSPSETKVSFDDKELVDRWGNFFKTLEIKRIPSESVFYEDPHDEILSIIVKTESSDYIFSTPLYFRRDGELALKIGENYYDFKSNEDFENLFNQVYDIAAERYGEVNLRQ